MQNDLGKTDQGDRVEEVKPTLGDLCPGCGHFLSDHRTPKDTCGWCGWDLKAGQPTGFSVPSDYDEGF